MTKINQEKTKIFFSKNAPTWHKSEIGNVPFEKYPVVRLPKAIFHLSQFCSQRDNVLDVGCGGGVSFASLSELGFKQIWGLDISEEMLNMARDSSNKINNDIPVKLIVGDTKSPTLPQSTFDAVLALGVATYVDNVEELLLDIKNLLKPSGIACLDFRNKSFNLFSSNAYTMATDSKQIVEFIKEFANKFSEIETHSNSYTQLNLLDDNHFANLQEVFNAEISELVALNSNLTDEILKKDNKLPYTMDRTQQTSLEVSKIVKKLKMTPLLFDYYHFHPLPPVFEKLMPRTFNMLGYLMESLGTTPAGFFQASSFLAVIQNER